ncbi:hypothetical protein F9U64_01190 [Gracilibacillus oryzae]|uniref:Phage protein n=1 Tax=Gracilibacillus oryzae TaxID=1672701 RepID=A0A7C8GVH3_9BACI|nr:hypothetical protein [Gracilibacillus oryzae]KAB8139268.1 hypothetical protein F9U64_01190 [Gracilibacillus oryzae]
MYNFDLIIDKYSLPFIAIIETDGGWKDGHYVEPSKQPVEHRGAILPLSDEDRRFDDGGTFTFEDKKIITQANLSKGTHVQTLDDEGEPIEEYEIINKRPYKPYSNFYVYQCKQVNLNDQTQ